MILKSSNSTADEISVYAKIQIRASIFNACDTHKKEYNIPSILYSSLIISASLRTYKTYTIILTFSWPWPIDRNLTLLVPNPDLSASLRRSLAGSDPGLKINTMGFVEALCSKMFSKLQNRQYYQGMRHSLRAGLFRWIWLVQLLERIIIFPDRPHRKKTYPDTEIDILRAIYSALYKCVLEWKQV